MIAKTLLSLILLLPSYSFEEPKALDPIMYSFDRSVSSECRNAIDAALETWSKQLPIRFVECATPETQHCVTFRFVEPSHGDLAPFSFLNRSLAHTVFGGPLPSEVHFNREMLSENGMDPSGVFQIALHEIGHVMGIPHSSDRRSVMFPNRSGSNGKQEILSSDLEAFALHLKAPARPGARPTLDFR